MSRLLLPCAAAVPGTVETGTLHLVQPGNTHCTICGQSKFKMRFHYTDELEMFTYFSGEDSFAMYDPAERLIKPYTTCGVFDGNSH